MNTPFGVQDASDNADLTAAGWLGRDAILMAGINATIYTFATLPTWVPCKLNTAQTKYFPDGTSWTVGVDAPFSCPGLLSYVFPHEPLSGLT